MRAAIIATMAFLLSGCILPGEITPIVRLTDLRFVSVAAERDSNSLTVLFTVKGDLRALSQEHARFLHINVWPCRQSSRYSAAMADPKVYDTIGAILPRSAGSNEANAYRFHMPIRARTLKDAPSYDLREVVEDICFSVSGAGPGLMEEPAYDVFSNSDAIPSSEITTSLQVRP